MDNTLVVTTTGTSSTGSGDSNTVAVTMVASPDGNSMLSTEVIH